MLYWESLASSKYLNATLAPLKLQPQDSYHRYLPHTISAQRISFVFLWSKDLIAFYTFRKGKIHCYLLRFILSTAEIHTFPYFLFPFSFMTCFLLNFRRVNSDVLAEKNKIRATRYFAAHTAVSGGHVTIWSNLCRTLTSILNSLILVTPGKMDASNESSVWMIAGDLLSLTLFAK